MVSLKIAIAPSGIVAGIPASYTITFKFLYFGRRETSLVEPADMPP